MEDPDIFSSHGIGSVVLDRVYIVDELPIGDQFPEPGQKRQMGYEDFERTMVQLNLGYPNFTQVGGPVPTALSVHGTWVNNIPIMIASDGDDHDAWTMHNDLVGRTINPRFITQLDKHGASSIVWIRKSNGARSILYTRGTKDLLNFDDFDYQEQKFPMTIGRAILHLDATEPAVSYMAKLVIRDDNGISYLDTGDFKEYKVNLASLGVINSEHSQDDDSIHAYSTMDLIQQVNVVQAPRRCALEIVKRMNHPSLANVPLEKLPLERLASMIRMYSKSDLVVVTDGIQGSGYSARGRFGKSTGFTPAHTTEIKGFPLRSVDENGAGDIFAGALSASLMMGDDLPEAMHIASVTAASSTRYIGNRDFVNYEVAKSLAFGRSLGL